MKMKLIIPVIAFFLIFSSCDKSMIENDFRHESDIMSARNEAASMHGQVVLNLRAHLTGDQEVPPRETLATGEAVFQLSKDGKELRYKLIVANLENLSMSHIHVAQAGVNGPVVAWLYPSAPPAVLLPGTTNGILNQGVITKDNLVGILAGHELSDLIDLIISEMTYVNIHTAQFPGGEIRGQIKGNVKAE